MNKKNIGAALSVVAAVAAGATAYASTINNLETDKNTNSMIKPYYSDNNYDYVSLVKSDYTEDLKNTSIANETRVVKNTNNTKEDVEKVEKAARELVSTTLSVETTNTDSTKEDSVETKEVIETTYEDSTEDVIAYNDSNVEEVEESEETSEQVSNEDNDEVIAYNADNLDKVFAKDTDADQELEVSENEVNNDEVVNYLGENDKLVEADKEMAETNESKDEATKADDSSDVKEEVKEAVVEKATKFVNVEALNLRSSKTMEDNSNIVSTLLAGDKVEGIVDGDWLKVDGGYLNLKYLSNAYPQELIDSIAKKAKEAEEAKIEEARKLEEEKKAKEQKAKEEAERKAAEEKAKAEEAERKAAEEKARAEEVKKQEEAAQAKQNYGEAFTGWVYNTATLNVREKARDGKILGTITNGTKVNGEIADGWVRFDYNGRLAFVSATYLTTTEANEEQANQQAVPVEEVVDEEITNEAVNQVEEVAAPVVNSNGQQAANIAGQFVGRPYVWGSSNPQVGFDCSGLMVHSYKQLGINLPHSSKAQYNSGYAVDKSNLQPGDLVFFNFRGSIDHVGMITSSDGTFIHASTPATGVRYDNIFNGSYNRTFVGARRIF